MRWFGRKQGPPPAKKDLPQRPKMRGGQAVNPRRRAEKADREMLGIRSGKAYRKYQRRERRRREEAV